MALLEDLTDDEAYLYAILSDESGVDLAEFTWKDEGNEDGCWRAWPFQWCLSGDTRVVTRTGVIPIKDAVGDLELVTHGEGQRGEWVKAKVQSFGRQRLWCLELDKRGQRKTIRATSEHMWFAGNGKAERRRYDECLTKDLKPGMYLKSTIAPMGKFSLDRAAVQRGVVWGDGTRIQGSSRVKLWGAKKALVDWFDIPGKPISDPAVSVDGLYVSPLPESHKTESVGLQEPDAALWGWLAGYFATDGSVLPDGTCVISSSDEASIDLVRDIGTALGLVVGAKNSRYQKSGYGSGGIAYHVVLRNRDLPVDFFLNPSHSNRINGLRSKRVGPDHSLADWKVVEVRETNDVEEVFCAIVPKTHSFVIDGNILTGNCWYRNTDKLQIDQCARSLGKSISIQLRGFIFPFVHPGQEMLITAPELVHLKPVVQSIEHRILSIRLSREMLDTRNRSTGFQHQPFAAQFTNGARILGRIPQRDGRGIKGMHPLWLELDEGQDYPAPGWTELFETLKFGDDHATWRAHGVTRGVRDTFYELTQNDSGWTVHRFTAQYRPDWSAAEREQKTKMYGGRNSHDYRRNIYGQHGDQTNPLFVLARLMACYRSDDNDPVCQNYVYERISDERMKQYQLPIEDFVQVPARHGTYSSVWVGMDVGMTNHPSEVLVFAEVPVQTRGKALSGTELALQLVSRWHMERITAGDQRRLLAKLNFIYKPKAISLDKTGVGLPIYQDMMEMSQELANVTKGYNFSSKIPVGFDDPTDIDDTLIMRNVLEYASDKLREYVDSGWVIFPNDEELIREWQGQGVTTVKSAMNPYGKKEFTKGTFHTLDAGRMAVLGKVQDPIEKILNDPIDGFGGGVMDVFYDGSGTYGY